MVLLDSLIYLDYQASTPLDPRIEMGPLFSDFGNPSSGQHAFGQARTQGLESARRSVAEMLGASKSDVIFTSGATEANNLAILGFRPARGLRSRLLASRVEHPSVLRAIELAESRGWEVGWLEVDSDGCVLLDSLDLELERGASLVSVMAGNNELGSLNDIAGISQLVRESGALLHVDATQFIGVELGPLYEVDMVSISSHKVYGPPGIGALIASPQARNQLSPLVVGGGQERGLRSGTENVPAAIGFGQACQLVANQLDHEVVRNRDLRDRLAGNLTLQLPDLRINGPRLEERLSSNLHVTVLGADAEAVMANAPGVAMATGSACSSAAPAPSHVLRAIGMPDDEAESSLRLSVGRFTTEAHIDLASERIVQAVGKVRKLTSTKSSTIGVNP